MRSPIFILGQPALLDTPLNAAYPWAIGRAAAAVFLALFLAGNGYHLHRFLEVGRGDYRGAFLQLAVDAEGGMVAFGADNDGRLPPMVWYGVREAERSTGKAFRPVLQDEVLAGFDPEWVVLQSPENQAEFPPDVGRAGHPTYVRVGVYPHYGLSGFTRALYRQRPLPSVP